LLPMTTTHDSSIPPRQLARLNPLTVFVGQRRLFASVHQLSGKLPYKESSLHTGTLPVMLRQLLAVTFNFWDH
jgi:hypothetical protein